MPVFSNRLLRSGLLFALIVGMPTHAANADEAELSRAKARIAELQQENRLLKARLKLLEDQVKHLKDKTKAAEMKAQALNPNADDPTRTKFDPKVGAAAQGLRVYQSALHILRELPNDLKPHPREGWDRSQYEGLTEWFKRHPSGNTFRSTMTVRSIRVTPTPSYVMKNGVKPWTVLLYVQPVNFKYVGVSLSQVIGYPPYGSSLKFYVDNDSAKSAEKIKVGQRVTIGAKIEKAVLQLKSSTSGSIGIYFSEYKLESPRIVK